MSKLSKKAKEFGILIGLSEKYMKKMRTNHDMPHQPVFDMILEYGRQDADPHPDNQYKEMKALVKYVLKEYK